MTSIWIHTDYFNNPLPNTSNSHSPRVQIDTAFWSHPKIKLVGQAIASFHLSALLFCNHHLTDGHIRPDDLTEIVHPIRELEVSHVRQPTLNGRSAPIADVLDEVVECLTDAGLWQVSDHGWVIHDFAEWQPTRAELVDAWEEREFRRLRERLRKRRVRGQLPRTASADTESKPPYGGVTDQCSSSVDVLPSASVSAQSRADTDEDQDPELTKPSKGDPEWFAQQLRGSDRRTPAAIRSVMRQHGLAEAALHEALEIVRERKPKNEPGYFVRCLQDIGKRRTEA